MPRSNIAAVQTWRAEFYAERASRAVATERRVQAWSLVVLMLTVLYVLIGHNPYQHDVSLDADTGGASLSPVNRYIWMTLAGLSAPLLWARRERLRTAAQRLWPLIALFGWFALSTLWALDPTAANRRLFLYIIGVIIALALALGFSDSRKLHAALAITCAVMVIIDLLSWIVAPGLSQTDVGLAAIHTHKNQLGEVMLFCGLVVAPNVMFPRAWRPRVFWGFILLAIMAMLVASQSKTSLAILIAVMLLTPMVQGLLKMRVLSIKAVCAGVVTTLFAPLFGWLAWSIAQGLDPLEPVEGITFTQRTDVWAFVISEIAKRPLTGAGFASFWDIDPTLQPSLNHDLWFGSPGLANQAHNGYLDLLATTGFIGLAGALFLLFRWISRGLILLRRTLLSAQPPPPGSLAAATSLGFFPLVIFAHNWMESSYFTANTIFGSMILIVGIDLDLRWSRGRSASGFSGNRPITRP